jgi:transposase-like protein
MDDEFIGVTIERLLDMICPHCKTECKKFGFFNRGDRCPRYHCDSCGKTFSDIPYRPLGRIKTPFGRVTQIINHLVEGVGMLATARLTHVHKNTVQSILEVAGSKCAFFLDHSVRQVTFPFVQVDEFFCFVGCKEKTIGRKTRSGDGNPFFLAWTQTANSSSIGRLANAIPARLKNICRT